jgi:hypothetical protein
MADLTLPVARNLSQDIAKTILDQLGGHRFVVITGARNLTSHLNALSFRLPTGSTKNKANYVKITLNGEDTYDIEFQAVRRYRATVTGHLAGIYADQLQEVFTAETGLGMSPGGAQ